LRTATYFVLRSLVKAFLLLLLLKVAVSVFAYIPNQLTFQLSVSCLFAQSLKAKPLTLSLSDVRIINRKRTNYLLYERTVYLHLTNEYSQVTFRIVYLPTFSHREATTTSADQIQTFFSLIDTCRCL
jgi:hypothetical protein